MNRSGRAAGCPPLFLARVFLARAVAGSGLGRLATLEREDTSSSDSRRFRTAISRPVRDLSEPAPGIIRRDSRFRDAQMILKLPVATGVKEEHTPRPEAL